MMSRPAARCLFAAAVILAMIVAGCGAGRDQSYPDAVRQDRLPPDIVKRGPKTDRHPPLLHSAEFAAPVPVPGPINTAGAEDSPFILPDGETLYFFFTPDVRVPHDQQLLDGVTGIYVAHQVDGLWTEPQRVHLAPPGQLALDGAPFVRGDEMWFCSAREGYAGVNMFTARLVDGQWVNPRYVGDRLMKELEVGEVHLHRDELYFHSARSGGQGGYDIWVTTREGDSWSDPAGIDAVNTAATEGWPFVSSDGNELWFTRNHLGTPAAFRSLRVNGAWGPPELIVSQFAGEPTLDDAGNLYFVHHYFEDGAMIEADMYVAYRKR